VSSICFASWAKLPGCVGSCRNAAAVLDVKWALIEEGSVPAAVIECDLLLLSSWTPVYETLLATRRGPTVVRWHSSLLQTELSGEIETLALIVDLLDQGRIAGIAANDHDLALALARPRIVHLPDVLDLTEYEGVDPTALSGTNVSLFGEAHGRKSLVVQSAAFERLRRAREGRDWTLHLNGQTRRRPFYERWLRLVGVPYVDHGFLERGEYLSLVAGMDAGLAASLAESYGLLAADHLALSVPVVSSSAVLSIGAGPLQAQEPWDVECVAGCLGRALDERSLVEQARRELLERATERALEARAAIERLIALA